MPRFLLRVEAVNLGGIIDDTDDLSTRRGGGLLALNAVVQLPKQLPTLQLEPIATGASVGLFSFDGEPESVANKVRDHFRDHTFEFPLVDTGMIGHLPLSVGTFVVDVVERTKSPNADVELATAKNRWRQLQQPTVSLEGLWDQKAVAECRYDCVRPQKPGARFDKHREQKESRFDVSASVLARHHYGRGRRQQFYQDELELPVGFEFTDEFHQIGTHDGLNESGLPNTTADKLAVFYADGNKFGEKGRIALAKPDGLTAFKTWSDGLKEHHRTLLRRLLNAASANDPTWWGRNNDHNLAVRLETLLWGGDEIIWVVPGWKGWELAELFFCESTAARPDLTYAAGLVFCGTKTPIHNVVKLAKRLGDVAKGAGGGNRLAYEVLESFDDITSDFVEHREKWLPKALQTPKSCPDNAPPDRFVISADGLIAARAAAREIARNDDFPLRQLYRLCKLWRNPVEAMPDAEKQKRAEAGRVREMVQALARLRAAGPGFDKFVKSFADSPVTWRAGPDSPVEHPVAWLHLLQMLPYVPAGGTL